MLSPDSPPTADAPPQVRLPWPCLCEKRRLLLLAAQPGGRSRSLGRFFGAAFLAFGLLLLLVGTQKSLPPALAGGGACIFAGLGLIAAVRKGAAPLLILDGGTDRAVLCRRRLGRRAFRLFPLDVLDWTESADGRLIHVRPQANGTAGAEIPGMASHISDLEWRQGMTLPSPDGSAVEAIGALERWQSLARQGEPPLVSDACDAAEFSALLGKALPAPLLQYLAGEAAPDLQAEPGGRLRDDAPDHHLRPPSAPHPEIRRAPDLRDSSDRRDKRD